MNKLDTFLQQATRGMWGRKRRDIMLELRGSIEARVWQLELRGMDCEIALEQVLREMGQAKAVANGFMEVHVMPRILKNTALIGLCAALTLTAINASKAQIEVVNYNSIYMSISDKTVTILHSENPIGPLDNSNRVYFLNFQSIKNNLEAARIPVDDTPLKPQETAEKYRGTTIPTLRFRFPEATRDTILQTAPSYDSPWLNAEGKLVLNPAPSADITNDHFYIYMWLFLQQLKTANLPISIEGWTNPSLKIGRTKIQIGTGQQSFTPWQWYSEVAARSLEQLDLQGINSWGYQGNGSHHAIRVNALMGSVYGIVTPFGSKNAVHLDIARVGENGILYFNAPYKVLEFVGTVKKLGAEKMDFSGKTPNGTSRHPAKALLIRIKPNLETQFEIPARTRSAAIR